MASFKFGFLVGVLALCSLGVLSVVITVLWAYNYLENTVYQSNAAVYQSVDFTVIRDQNQMYFTNPAESNEFFELTLKNAFDLDAQMKPTANSPKIIAGPVQVVSLTLKNESNPMTLGNTTVNVNPAIHSVIKVPIKLPYVSLSVMSTIDVLTVLPTSY